MVSGSSGRGGGKRIHVESSTDKGQVWTEDSLNGYDHGAIQLMISLHS
jgi:hypothetical protein